ncbi:MAG: response regulator [Eubacteriales bacterium]|nr:response regulator [Eubacteriales bacterium]
MNLLIVDDEYYNVENIRDIISQMRPEFDNIFCAYNLHHALDYFSKYDISIMICDIEMPGGSGLDLLEQIRNMGNETICIFLTAFAKFEYISTAMKLSSNDYLLKPVDDDELLSAVDKAILKFHRNRQDSINTRHAQYWKESELYLTEIFWQDLLSGSINSSESDISNELNFRKLNTDLLSVSYYLLLIEGHPDRQTLLNHSLYEFILKNIVREYFYHEDELPVVVRLTRDFYLLPLPNDAARTRDEIISLCHRAFDCFVSHFPNNFNFYVSATPCRMTESERCSRELLSATEKNVSLENHVFDLSLPIFSNYNIKEHPIPLEQWGILLSQGKTERLCEDSQWYLKTLFHSGHVTRESLTAFYYGFLQMLLNQLQKEQQPESLQLFYGNLAYCSVNQICSSIHSLNQWIPEILNIYTICSTRKENPDSVVNTVISYIQNHLDEDMNRNTLAATVFLNPDYLSHIFKKETGQSLINFIINERIAKSKQLLSETNLSIRDIAITCGFQNISYFSRQFKKSVGMTPREFRG